MESGFQINVTEGPDAGTTFPLNHTRITVGRARHQGAEATGWLLLFDKSVSREHAEFVWNAEDKEFHLRHLSKTNLTWVDESKLDGDVALRPGQEIRVGKSKLVVEARTVASEGEKSVDEPLAATGELTERLNLGNIAASLSLREGESPTLCVTAGPNKGEKHVLGGFMVGLGTKCTEKAEVYEGEPVVKFDQLIELSDPGLVPNHLILRWDALEKGFSLRQATAGSTVTVTRESDGFTWAAKLPTKGGLLRAGDRIDVGDSSFELRAPGHQSKKLSVRSLSLPDKE